MNRSRTLTREQWLPRPRSEVFAFFSRAGNLERLTPPSLRFEILTPLPIVMQPGTLIDYRLRLLGVPFRWQTLIEVYEPDTHFVDVQLRGPYARWRHTHRFEVVDGGTRMLDEVAYALPLGPLGDLAHALLVHRQLCGIFDYRREVIARQFG